MAQTTRIRRDEQGGVTILRVLDRYLYDDGVVRAAAEQILAALPTGGPILVILDMTGVQQVSSAMLGKLILLQRKAEASGGRLRICELSTEILDVLKTTNLDRLFAIDRDLPAALEAIRR